MSTATKKKSLMIVLAVVLVAALAVAGTLMLFTDQSEKATNVVTIGEGLHISLYENGKKITVDSAPLELTTAPGSLLKKIPKVQHEGGSDAYLRVKTVIDFEDVLDIDAGTLQAAMNEIARIGNPISSLAKTYSELSDNAKSVATILYSVTSGSVGSDWIFVFETNGSSYVFNGTEVHGYFYYVAKSGGSITGLKALIANDPATATNEGRTSSVFSIGDTINDEGLRLSAVTDIGKATSLKFENVQEFLFPADGGIDTDDFITNWPLFGKTVDISLQAQAVQITDDASGLSQTSTSLLSSYFDYQSLS